MTQIDYKNPVQILADLVYALDNAYISSWQSTYEWQKQLDVAKEYLEEIYND